MEREKLVSLVKAVQTGKEGAAGDLYAAFFDDIYYFILKTVNSDPELAEDLTQDTFLEILETIDKLQEPAAFVTWSKQIAYHKCTGHFRKRREVLVDEEEDGYSAFDTLEEERAEFIPDEALDQEDFKQTIQNMINELPEDQRSALLLYYYNEMSVKEIAKIQDTNEGTVKSRLNYGRKTIKKAVESYEKRNGVRLHIAGVTPMLLWFFRASRNTNGGAAASGASGSGSAATAAASGSAAAVATGAKAGLAAMGKVAATKVVAAVAAAAVGIAGVTAAVTTLLKKPEPEKWVGFACEYQTERKWVGTESEGHMEEISTPVENSQMTFELELLEAEEYAYTGNLTVTWEDGEVFRTPCRLGDFHNRNGVYFYTLHIDPMFTRNESGEEVFNETEFLQDISVVFPPGPNEMDIDYISADINIMGELITENPEESLLVKQPIKEQPASITESENGNLLLQYMKDIDGNYGWLGGEEYEAAKDFYAEDTGEDGHRRAYEKVVYLRLPDSDEVTAMIGVDTIYHDPLVHVVVEREAGGLPVTRFRSSVSFSMESIEIPDTVVILEDEAFHNCMQLKKMELPESVRYIGERAFHGCASLEKVELPEGLKAVGSFPFYQCTSLKKVSIPSTLVNVEGYLFYNCPSLEQLEVADGNPVYHSSGNCMIETETKTLIAGCKTSEIPADGSVTVIGRYAFAGNDGLKELVVPEGVTEIGCYAFVKCSNLKEITLPRSLETLDDQAFKFCEDLSHIHYAGTMEEFGKIQGIDWDAPYHDYRITVHCSDGDLTVR